MKLLYMLEYGYSSPISRPFISSSSHIQTKSGKGLTFLTIACAVRMKLARFIELSAFSATEIFGGAFFAAAIRAQR